MDWRYYNHAAIPEIAPTETPDCTSIENGSIWNDMSKTPLLARWTTDFDCGYETNWWYVIKDEPFDIDSLKAKRRYEINKGIKNFDVRIINPCEYKEELYRVQTAAFSAYPSKYRPTVDKNEFVNGICSWTFTVFGAFFRETNELAGYALLSKESNSFLNFNVLKTNPDLEKYAVNAALVQKIVTHYTEFLSSGGIICDGSRSISHETNFQNYLEKYFGFRKAYCHLHIQYNPQIKWLIKILFSLRRFFLVFDGIGIVHRINGVLKMEEIYRSDVFGRRDLEENL